MTLRSKETEMGLVPSKLAQILSGCVVASCWAYSCVKAKRKDLSLNKSFIKENCH